MAGLLQAGLPFHILRGCRAGETTFQFEISQSSDWDPGSEAGQSAFPMLGLGCRQRGKRDPWM